MPVWEGGSSANPGPPRRGTRSSRQRYPASSCHGTGGPAPWHAEPSETSETSETSAQPAARLAAARTQYGVDLPARLRLPLYFGPHLGCVRHQRRDEGAGRRVRAATPVGMRGAAARVEPLLQHAQLLCRHRHLVGREWLQLVDTPLVVERRRVRARQLDVLFVLELLKQARRTVGRAGGEE